jgi:hypothetical protein
MAEVFEGSMHRSRFHLTSRMRRFYCAGRLTARVSALLGHGRSLPVYNPAGKPLRDRLWDKLSASMTLKE